MDRRRWCLMQIRCVLLSVVLIIAGCSNGTRTDTSSADNKAADSPKEMPQSRKRAHFYVHDGNAAPRLLEIKENRWILEGAENQAVAAIIGLRHDRATLLQYEALQPFMHRGKRSLPVQLLVLYIDEPKNQKLLEAMRQQRHWGDKVKIPMVLLSCPDGSFYHYSGLVPAQMVLHELSQCTPKES